MAEEFAIDRELGEVLQENEEQLTREIADHIAAKIRQGPRPALRDAHPKPHGIVKAVFKVEDDLEPQLAQGVFVPGQKYDAWIRFSNGNEDPTKPDAGGDARGMAIKLLDVPGDKILPTERQGREQDFIMINHPAFFIDHPARYLELERAKDTLFRLLEEKKDGFLHLLHATNISDVETVLKGVPALSPQGLLNFIAMSSSKIASPLETRYWSMVPYRLGDPPLKRAIKFAARPCLPEDAATIPSAPSPNFLRETMIKQLLAGPRKFDFEVQLGRPNMSVENSLVEWKEEHARFIRVATITIPKQEFSTPKQDQFGERLSFTPWHALPQHRPLGAVNRIRRVVYQKISELRNSLNPIP